MPKATYGDVPKARAMRLLRAIVAFANGELEEYEHLEKHLKCLWQQDSQPPKLMVKTTLRTLARLCQKDTHRDEPTKKEVQEIREALDCMEDFLYILEDHRISKRGLETWHFTLTLWSKDITENLKRFEQDWEERRPTKSKEQSVGGQTIQPELGIRQQPLGKPSTVPELPLKYLPRPDTLRQLKTLVLAEGNQTVVVTGATGKASRKVGVQGMGGIGKSVLATALAHDEEIQRAFPDGIIWVTLGQTPALPARQTQVATAFLQNQPTFEDVQQGKAFLSQLLADKSCLLVLDDVWQLDHATAFNVLGSASQLLITTRKAELITALGAQPYQVELLNEAEALKLLAESAEQDETTLPEDAKVIIRECGRLPLAVAIVGAMARGNPNRWGGLLKRLQQADLDKIEQQFRNYEYPNLLRAIQVSVDDLEPEPKQRYLDLAVFPEDTPISPAALQTFWQGEGMDELEIEITIQIFVDRSLLQQDEQRFLHLHDLLRDYLGKQVEQELPTLHNRLLDAYAAGCPNGWASGANDGYFFENLAYHLKNAGREQELWQLLTESPAWMEVKFNACTGDSAYVADLELALADFVDPLPSEQLLTLIQLHTARQVVHQRVGYYKDDDLVTLVWLNRDAEALSHARLRSKNYGRFQGIWVIYLALKKRGDMRSQLLDEALATARLIEYSWSRASALRDVAKALAETQQLDAASNTLNEAFATAQSIEDSGSRASALRDVAKALAETQQFDAAFEVAQSIEDSRSRASALRDVAKALAETQQPDAALATAQSMEDSLGRAYVLSAVAKALVETQQLDAASNTLNEALATAQSIEDSGSRAYALSAVAGALVETQQLDAALEVAQSIEDSRSRAYALSAVAGALVETQQLDAASNTLNEALATAQSIEDSGSRAYALSAVAGALVETQQLDAASNTLNEALATAQSIENFLGWAFTVRDVARALAETQQLDAALKVARSIKDSGSRAEALSAVAEALAETQQLDAASNTLNEALATAQSIEASRSRAEALSAVARALVETQQLDAALEVAQSIEDSLSRAYALRDVARALAETQQPDAALKVAQSIKDSERRAEALRDVARALAETQQLDAASNALNEALATAQSIERSGSRAKALSAVARALAETQQPDAALEVAQSIKGERRAYALRDLARALAETQQPDAALKVAQSIKDSGSRAEALSAVAKALAETQQLDAASNTLNEALATAQSIEDSRSSRVYALRAVAKALAETQQPDAALEVARLIERSLSRAYALSAVARALAETQQLDAASNTLNEALATAQSIEDSLERAYTLSDVARALAETQQLDAASNTLDEALATAQSIEDSKERVYALRAVAEALVETQQLDAASNTFDEALATAQSIEDSKERASALSAVARALAETQQLDAALEVARSIEDSLSRAEAVSDVAKALAETQQLDAALEVAQSIEDSERRAEALGAVAKNLIKCHRIVQAFDALELRDTNEFLVSLVTWQVMFNQVEAGEPLQLLKEAIRIVGWIRPQWRKIYELLSSTSSGRSIT